MAAERRAQDIGGSQRNSIWMYPVPPGVISLFLRQSTITTTTTTIKRLEHSDSLIVYVFYYARIIGNQIRMNSFISRVFTGHFKQHRVVRDVTKA
jgi:hypothetical protein